MSKQMKKASVPLRVKDELTGKNLDPRTHPEAYYMSKIRNADVWTPENVRLEYERLRAIAEKRLEVMGKEKVGRESDVYRMNIGKYKPASELSPGEQKLALFDIARFIGAKRGTLAGIKRARREAVKTLQERGYTFVTARNIRQFGEFMENWRQSENRSYGSQIATDVYETGINMGHRPEEIGRLFFDYEEEQRKAKRKSKRRKKNQELAGYELLADFTDWLDKKP